MQSSRYVRRFARPVGRLRPSTRIGILGLILLLLVSGWASIPWASTSGSGLGPSSGSALSASLVPQTTSTNSASVTVAAFSTSLGIPFSFWGVNVEPNQAFVSSDVKAIDRAPVRFVRFPGGILGEELNYTSGIVTDTAGAHSKTAVSVAQFIALCRQLHCHAILQLPAEVDAPATAAYYAKYVVHALGFQPAFWEIGNAVPGWKHFQVPWSRWGSASGKTVTPTAFATLVRQYIAAVKKVDPAGRFLALGIGMGAKNYGKPWVETLASADGHMLAGISVHSYIIGGPSRPTASELFANLRGSYSLPDQVRADAGYLRQACPTCRGLGVYVTEINAAELSSYDQLLPTFAGTLYLAAETTQGLALRVPNLDWFCFRCDYPGAWSRSPTNWHAQYYLFADMMSHLMRRYLPATLSGPSTFYAVATYAPTTGLALLLINVNTANPLSVALGHSGIRLGATVQRYVWGSATALPVHSWWTTTNSISVGKESMVLLVAAPAQLT